jgi:DNA-binding FadR family transcriptional regulator
MRRRLHPQYRGSALARISQSLWRHAVETCRELDVQEIFDLYELRKSIEIAAIRLAIKRARVR